MEIYCNFLYRYLYGSCKFFFKKVKYKCLDVYYFYRIMEMLLMSRKEVWVFVDKRLLNVSDGFFKYRRDSSS